MKTIKLGNFEMDLEVFLETKGLLQANSGGGKSWGLREIIEKAYGKVPIVIMDTEGEFENLREKFNFILVGKGGDIPASIKTAGVLAHRILELGLNAIIDISELKAHERTLFVKRFQEALIEAPKNIWRVILYILDEAQAYAPEAGKSEALPSTIDIAKRGRKRGIGALYATQRISDFNKGIVAECNNRFIGRTGMDIDRRRAAKELGFTTQEQEHSLKLLDPGEFYVYGPALSRDVKKVRFGNLQVAPPKAGSRAMAAPTPTPEAVKDLVSKLTDLDKAADEEMKTVEDYKAKIRSLTAELSATKRVPIVPTVDVRKAAVEIRNARVEADKEGYARGYNEGVEKVLKEKAAATRGILKGLAIMREQINLIEYGSKEDKNTIKIINTPVSQKISHLLQPKQRPIESTVSTEPMGELSNAHTRVLYAMGRIEAMGVTPASKDMVAAFSRYKPSSGGFRNLLGSLRSAGMINYPSPSMLELTDEGRSVAAEALQSPATEEELQENWKSVMSAAQRKVFEAALEAYPEAVEKQSLAESVGYMPSSGGYRNLLGSLRSMGAIEYPEPGTVRASNNCFVRGS